ncbi:SUKH-4 family immunity protein [Actinosynnema sp. NPDC020468]|uniref:SUKH-4 family immunity protein n=1 Tax=Actinosynnema sp. NPDC020468 TaxID=3154488 RepID=UPI00340E786C
MLIPWPDDEVVAVPSAAGVGREVAAWLVDPGVPRRFFGAEYRVLAEAVVLSGAHAGLVAFASCGEEGRLCVERPTGRVVLVPRVGAEGFGVVNGSVRAFVDSVAFVVGRFPYYSGDGDFAELLDSEEFERVAEELRFGLLDVDETALDDPDGVWAAFLEDVGMGVHLTEVFAPPPGGRRETHRG